MFKDIGLSLMKDNYEKCAPYCSMGPNYILQCRHGFVYATGNLSYSDPLLNLYKLSYVPVLILDSHFPIQLNGKRIYKSNICEASQNIAITHETFFQFHTKNKDDKNKNLTFHSSLVHHAFAKIKHLEPGNIVELIGSNMFIFYTVLIILAIILALMICFCPGVVFCILSAMFSQIVKFATSLFSLFYRGLQFFNTSIVAAYQSRQNENIPDNDVQIAPPIVRTVQP